MKFVYLTVYSDYSLLDGYSTIYKIIDKAVELNMKSIALTDTNLFGIIKFYNYAILKNIKPIIGVKVFLKHPCLEQKICSIILLANTNVGYYNIKKIVSQSYFNYYQNIPIVKYSELIKNCIGISIISGYDSDISYCIKKKKYKLVNFILKFYKKYFNDSFYFSINSINNDFYYENRIIILSYKYSIKIIAIHEIKFVNSSDFQYFILKKSIYLNKKIDDIKQKEFINKECFIKSDLDILLLFKNKIEYINNTICLSNKCNVNIIQNQFLVPNFYSNYIFEKQKFIELSSSGLNKRLLFYKKNNISFSKKKYLNRLIDELLIIIKMNFVSYFLVVMEFVLWSKKKNIPVGPGRGSGVSSLVAFSLKITEIDPIFFDLLFERFLNPYRISMPDIDIDFCMEKRDLVIEHINKKYGYFNVVHIITFGTLTARAAIRDVSRSLGFSYNFALRLSKMIPKESDISISKSLKINLELNNLYNTDFEIKEVINSSLMLEGIVKTIGTHSGGIIISPSNIIDFAPFYKDNKSNILLTQYDKDDLEKIGLIKFDFLALKTLTIIQNVLSFIEKKNKIKISYLNINKIPLDDKKSFLFLNKCFTLGVFQLESFGMKNLIHRLNPDKFSDLIALIALYRPGPIYSGMVENYIQRKLGKEKISYPDKRWEHIILSNILKETYGIILYQEQIIKIVQIIAGYSLQEADVLRMIISKKKKNDMLFHKFKFQIGAKKRGFDRFFAVKIFDILEKFSEYGFNKAHSTAYAMITYQTLWLKSNYTIEFLCALLNSEINDTVKLVKIIYECKFLQIKILPPNINISNYLFYIKDNKIIYGLGAIKGLGKIIVDYILLKRNMIFNKKFNTFLEFCELCFENIHKNVFENLIYSGSFDTLYENRECLLEIYPKLIKALSFLNNNKKKGKIDLFENNILFNILNINNIDEKNLIILQKKIDYEIISLGWYFTKSNIILFSQEVQFFSCYFINEIKKGKKYKLIVSVNSFKFINTKNNTKILFINVYDNTHELNIIVFNKDLNFFLNYLEKDMILIIYGCLSNWKSHENNFICEKVGDFIYYLQNNVKSLILNISVDLFKIIKKLMYILKVNCRGSVNIYLNIIFKNKILYIKLNKFYNVYLSYFLLVDLKLLLGNKNVNFKFI